MKSIAKFVALLLGSALLLSGCSAISSMLYGDSKDADLDAHTDMSAAEAELEAVESVIQFTFYDSFANW